MDFVNGNDDLFEDGSLIDQCLRQSIIHPLNYARFLVQIGHEPLLPYYDKPLFGKKRLIYPNLLVYAKHIYSVDGFKGMYTGLGPEIIGICIGHFSSLLLANYIKLHEMQNVQLWTNCALNTSKEMIFTATSIILSHPLHVVSMRMMAQFVGHEHRYMSIFQSILLINQEEGLNGLYSGIIPRLVAGLSTVFINNVAKQVFTYFFNNPTPSNLKLFCSFSEIVAMAETYRFNVVTAYTAINNCGLAAGMPPDVPVFGNWLDCMRYLDEFDQLDRGLSAFYRYVPNNSLNNRN